VREAVGIAAYHAGEWQTALSEIRTYHRITGKQTHLAILADCERALGRPEKAIDIFRTVGSQGTGSAEAIELLIVAAGARRDMGQDEAALSMLQIRELTADAPWAGRLRYAYADALFGLGRRDEAREWFARAVDADPEGETDAAERLLEIDGVDLDDDDETDDPDLALALAHQEIDDREVSERTETDRAARSAADASAGPTAADRDDFDEDDEDDDDLDDDEDDEDEDEDEDDEDDEDFDDDDGLGDDEDEDDEDDDGDWEQYEPVVATNEALSEPIGELTRPAGETDDADDAEESEEDEAGEDEEHAADRRA